MKIVRVTWEKAARMD